MKHKGKITVKFRRKREGKTDYRKRLKLLASYLPRLVVRKSNRYITAQIVASKEAQDFVVCNASSKELQKYGWKNGTKNLPASYLTCFLLANKLNNKLHKKENKEKIKKAILDIGLQSSTKGSRLYACLKGAVDAGLEVPHSLEILPANERLWGLHINDKLSKLLEETKEKIISEFKK